MPLISPSLHGNYGRRIRNERNGSWPANGHPSIGRDGTIGPSGRSKTDERCSVRLPGRFRSTEIRDGLDLVAFGIPPSVADNQHTTRHDGGDDDDGNNNDDDNDNHG